MYQHINAVIKVLILFVYNIMIITVQGSQIVCKEI